MHTGERFTQARAALAAERGVVGPLVGNRTRSILGQLADIELAATCVSSGSPMTAATGCRPT